MRQVLGDISSIPCPECGSSTMYRIDLRNMTVLNPQVVIKKAAYNNLLYHVYTTDFKYETRGILLRYIFFYRHFM